MLHRLKSLTSSLICTLCFLSLTLLAPTITSAQSSAQTDLPKRALSISEHVIDVQVASTPEQLAKGLMWRTSMPLNEGMLFVFDRPAIQCFWMKNTLLPLSAAFIDDLGQITNIADMAPLSTQSHCSNKPVRFVLEMRQGWFKQRGIGPNSQVKALDTLMLTP